MLPALPGERGERSGLAEDTAAACWGEAQLSVSQADGFDSNGLQVAHPSGHGTSLFSVLGSREEKQVSASAGLP